MRKLRNGGWVSGLAAVLLLGVVLAGCGGSGSPAGPAGGQAVVNLKLTTPVAGKVVTARGAAVSGATVFVDGVAAGVTDADGEVTLELAAGTHTITVVSGGVSSTPLSVTVTDGAVVEVEVEMEADGTLNVEQDVDDDGDVDADDLDDLDDEDGGDVDDDEDDDEDEDDEVEDEDEVDED